MFTIEESIKKENGNLLLSVNMDTAADLAELPTMTDKKTLVAPAYHGSTALDLSTGDLYFLSSSGWIKP